MSSQEMQALALYPCNRLATLGKTINKTPCKSIYQNTATEHYGCPSYHTFTRCSRMPLFEQAQNLGCDLMVIGKHGKGVIEELLLGSVTKHVLGESTVDVWWYAETINKQE